MSFAPPPIEDNVGVFSLANSSNSDFFSWISFFTNSILFILISWIWARIIFPLLFAVNPPFFLPIPAALLHAAITDGSSVAKGIKYSFSLMIKFVTMPNGIEIPPTVFSIIFAASSSSIPDIDSIILISSFVKLANSFNLLDLSLAFSL